MDKSLKGSKRFNHRFTVIQIFSLLLSYIILLGHNIRDLNYSHFLFIGLALLYLEWAANYILEKFYKPTEDGYESFKRILENWSIGFIGVHIFLIILIVSQIRFGFVLSVWWIILSIIILHLAIVLFVKNRKISLPNYPITEKLHKYRFTFRNEASYVFIAGWVIHFGEYPNTLKIIALVIAFIAFIYYHLGNYVNLKELDELERQIKLEQVYLGMPIAMAIFYASEFVRSTYKLGFSTTELFFALSIISVFLSFIVRKKYE